MRFQCGLHKRQFGYGRLRRPILPGTGLLGRKFRDSVCFQRLFYLFFIYFLCCAQKGAKQKFSATNELINGFCLADWTINFSHQKDWNVVLTSMLQAVQLQHAEQSELSIYPWHIRRLAIHPQKFMAANPQGKPLSGLTNP